MKSLFSILTILLLFGCSKDGSIGPQGEPGVRGEKGEDGTIIYSGAIIPTNDIGQIGDFYFRINTSDFYGPKTNSGWGSPTNLRGATGATGAAGSKILSGATVPANNLGINGDFYFRTSTADFYGPKSANSWGTPINLKGLKGEDGSRIFSGTTVPASNLGNIGDFYFRTTTADFYGPKLASGWGSATNLKGTTGDPGSKILSGTAVPTAAVGVNGDFYLRTTTASLYGPKTFSGWGTPISLRGPVGPTGPEGNANVKQFTIAGFNAPTNILTKTIPLNNVEFKESILFTYILKDGWNPLPGHVGPLHQYSIKYSNGGFPNTSIQITKTEGTIPQFFDEMRVYAIKINTFITVSSNNKGLYSPEGVFISKENLGRLSEKEFRRVLNLKDED